MNRLFAYVAVAVVVAGCTAAPEPRPPIPITPAGDEKGAAVVRRTLPPPAPEAPTVAPNAVAAAPSSLAPLVFPPDVQYVCVTNVAGERRQVAIQFDTKVRELCRKHPEMGPCQYERNVCRSSGGRVFASNGQEITMVTEAEYDKKVMRVRFRAN